MQVDSPRAGAAAKYLGDERAVAVLAALDRIAEAHQAVAAAALAWARAKPGLVAPVASARSADLTVH